MKPEIQAREVSLETLITNAIQLPGVKVDRQKFLLETFGKRTDVDLQEVLAVGPVEAKCARETLSQIAGKLIAVETGKSSIASFGMGLPGGLAMGVTIPADAVQFFGMSLRLAQELSYLYGARDLWKEGEVDEEAVKGQLCPVLWCYVWRDRSLRWGAPALLSCGRDTGAKTGTTGTDQNGLVSCGQADWQSSGNQNHQKHRCKGCDQGCAGDRRRYLRGVEPCFHASHGKTAGRDDGSGSLCLYGGRDCSRL